MKRDSRQRARMGRSLLLWLSLLAGSAAGALWMLRRAIASHSRSAGPRDASKLLAAIPGNTRESVIAVFGKPRASAGFNSVAPAILVSSDYRHAETWYYPLDLASEIALVVHFVQDIARDAQLVNFPNPSAIIIQSPLPPEEG